jgi:hypothetical protein
MESLNTSSV